MSFAITKIKNVLPRISKISQINNLVLRQSSFKSSEFLEDVTINSKFDVTRDPVDWKYVERILSITTIPEPLKKEKYPSGWKPQAETFPNSPYFVARTKNHMIPVYLKLAQHNIRRHTVIKKIQGDIWLLEKEIREFLQKETVVPIRSQVNEFCGFICINGDYVNAVKYWLEQKNF